MERSGFGTIRRERSGRYQARVRVRRRHFGIGTFNTRREAAQALGRFAASYETRTPLDRKAGRETIGEFAKSWWKTRTGKGPRRVGLSDRPGIRAGHSVGTVQSIRSRTLTDRRPKCGIARHSIATCCRFSATHRHLFPEIDKQAAQKLELVRETLRVGER